MMMIQHSNLHQYQLELPFWGDEDDYSRVTRAGLNRFDPVVNPLCWMMNSFQWVTTPERNGFWGDALRRVQFLEASGVTNSHTVISYSMGDLLLVSFNFSETTEGQDYWCDVVRRLRCIDRVFDMRKLDLDNNGTV